MDSFSVVLPRPGLDSAALSSFTSRLQAKSKSKDEKVSPERLLEAPTPSSGAPPSDEAAAVGPEPGGVAAESKVVNTTHPVEASFQYESALRQSDHAGLSKDELEYLKSAGEMEIRRREKLRVEEEEKAVFSGRGWKVEEEEERFPVPLPKIEKLEGQEEQTEEVVEGTAAATSYLTTCTTSDLFPPLSHFPPPSSIPPISSEVVEKEQQNSEEKNDLSPPPLPPSPSGEKKEEKSVDPKEIAAEGGEECEHNSIILLHPGPLPSDGKEGEGEGAAQYPEFVELDESEERVKEEQWRLVRGEGGEARREAETTPPEVGSSRGEQLKLRAEVEGKKVESERKEESQDGKEKKNNQVAITKESFLRKRLEEARKRMREAHPISSSKLKEKVEEKVEDSKRRAMSSSSGKQEKLKKSRGKEKRRKRSRERESSSSVSDSEKVKKHRRRSRAESESESESESDASRRGRRHRRSSSRGERRRRERKEREKRRGRRGEEAEESPRRGGDRPRESAHRRAGKERVSSMVKRKR